MVTIYYTMNCPNDSIERSRVSLLQMETHVIEPQPTMPHFAEFSWANFNQTKGPGKWNRARK